MIAEAFPAPWLSWTRLRAPQAALAARIDV